MLKSKLISEFIGTFALLFFGCGGVIAAQNGMIPGAVVPLLFGGALAIGIYSMGHISGGHFNPAVTLGLMVSKRFPKAEVIPYWVSQIAGAFAACLLLKFILNESLEPTVTQLNVGVIPGFIWETIMTFFLVFVIHGVATDSRAPGMMIGFCVCLTIILDAFVGGAYTGASMNPARSIAPAILTGNFANLWVYIAAPLAGGALAAITYGSIRGNK